MQATEQDLYRQANGADAPMAEHTPGPLIANGPWIETQHGETVGQAFHVDGGGREVSLANATLFAAAHDLLAALRNMVKDAKAFPHHLQHAALITAADAAVAKATGVAA